MRPLHQPPLIDDLQDYTLVEVVRGESPYEFRELVSGGDFIGSRSISKAMLEMVEEQLGDHPGEGNLREARRWLRHQFISFHIATIDQSEGVLLIQTDPPITISKRQILERVYLPFYAKLLEMYHGRFRTGFGPCTQVNVESRLDVFSCSLSPGIVDGGNYRQHHVPRFR